MEAGWAKALEPVEERIAAMGDFLRAEIAAGRTYLPAGPNVLRAFQQPFDEVKVLIVGQDPYPTPGHAVGLSFSVAPEVRPLPGSLENIYRELHTDLGLPRPSNGDLTPWTQQGVLLLNKALTTAPRRPAAHRGKGWEEVTEQAIRALAGRGRPLVAILWGRDARNVRPLLGSLPAVESAHPSPCPPTADSSAPVPSAAPMSCWHSRGRSPSTGAFPDPIVPGGRGVVCPP
ncbi:uracil-DNA glycosylase 1 [Streptomyces violaceusniger]|uniref:Uracil-DNA glycosylase 1 n=1 Tax=Streptomyces violaceusniger TaxID=68280 RepID=A0A4D4KRC6_STRVO|nr:uracil-DNA glycosylase 1 [Streptomyces violaceusniger]